MLAQQALTHWHAPYWCQQPVYSTLVSQPASAGKPSFGRLSCLYVIMIALECKQFFIWHYYNIVHELMLIQHCSMQWTKMTDHMMTLCSAVVMGMNVQYTSGLICTASCTVWGTDDCHGILDCSRSGVLVGLSMLVRETGPTWCACSAGCSSLCLPHLNCMYRQTEITSQTICYSYYMPFNKVRYPVQANRQ